MNTMAGWLNPDGLIFLSFLIPLLLLYLIKPKPLRKTIPSLMFILSDTGKNPINRMFKNWFTDILFIFHILIFGLLAASLAEPFIDVPQGFSVQDSVIILDTSASMKEYFPEAKDLAEDAIGSRTTIILAQGVAERIADEVPGSRARNILDDLDVKDTTTNLADAIQLADAGPETQVTIISDFLPSQGSLQIQPYIESLESQGALITIHNLGSPRENVGIIDLQVRAEESRVWVKNYANAPEEITLSIGGNEQQVLLAKQETKEITFQTPAGVTEITIEEDDAFMTDNTAYISTPVDNQIDMLVFTNDQEGFENSRIKLAYDVLQMNFPITINVEYGVWPRVPDLNHDVYVFYNSDPDLIIPGYIQDLQERVEDGAAFFIFDQEGLFGMDLEGMMPVEYVDEGASGEVLAAQTNLLTNDIVFGQVQSYAKVSAKEGVTTIAEVAGDPILTISKLGEGTIFYYGYQEGTESFSAENSYPIFWRRVIDLATDRPTLRSLNVDTGELLSFTKEERIDTPRGRVDTNLLRADYAGRYELSDRTIAANLLSDLESNTNREAAIDSVQSGTEEGENTVPYELATIGIILGMLILFFELVYIKFRGDI